MVRTLYTGFFEPKVLESLKSRLNLATTCAAVSRQKLWHSVARFHLQFFRPCRTGMTFGRAAQPPTESKVALCAAANRVRLHEHCDALLDVRERVQAPDKVCERLRTYFPADLHLDRRSLRGKEQLCAELGG